MGWTDTLITVGGGILSSYLGARAQSRAASKAMDVQTQAYDKAIASQREMFNRVWEEYAPYREAGVAALGETLEYDPTEELTGFTKELEELRDFTPDETDPMYQWQLDQITKRINQAAAARGLYGSTPTVGAIGEATRALAAQEGGRQYSQRLSNILDRFNLQSKISGLRYGRLGDLINVGTGASGVTGQAAVATGQGLGSTYGSLGRSQAQNILGQGQVQGQFLSGLGSLYPNALATQAYTNILDRYKP